MKLNLSTTHSRRTKGQPLLKSLQPDLTRITIHLSVNAARREWKSLSSNRNHWNSTRTKTNRITTASLTTTKTLKWLLSSKRGSRNQLGMTYWSQSELWRLTRFLSRTGKLNPNLINSGEKSWKLVHTSWSRPRSWMFLEKNGMKWTTSKSRNTRKFLKEVSHSDLNL